MSDLRTAAQQALVALENTGDLWWNSKDEAITALRAALEQPEQEPYAWMSVGGSIWRRKGSEDDVPLFTHPPRRTGLPHCERSCEATAFKIEIRRLKAALEQMERTLTDEIIADLWHQNGGFYHHFARAIERWLRG